MQKKNQYTDLEIQYELYPCLYYYFNFTTNWLMSYRVAMKIELNTNLIYLN